MARLNAVLDATLADPEVRARFEAGGTEVATNTTPEAAAAYVASQRATWVPVARSLGLVLN
jgi:tripartite-type tricarboxylate transporter receptor subunit TctC